MPEIQKPSEPNTQPVPPLSPDSKPPDMQDDPPPELEAAASNDNEGEGNKTADKNYREGVQKHLKTHDVTKEGKDAAAALDDPKQAADLKKAEDAGRKPNRT